MLDLNDPRDLKAFEEAEHHARTMQGTNFCLVMRNPDGDLSVYPRQNQPCQGGEMRKYESTHPNDCTRPKDRRPTDLKMPFPDGIPEAVSIHFNRTDVCDDFLDQLFAKSSPYHRAVGDVKPIRLVHERFNSIEGLVFTNTEVDSTLFVNMLQFIKSCNFHAWEEAVDSGVLSDDEVIGTLLMTNPSLSKKSNPPVAHSYYFATVPAVHRVVNGDPHDLTGGTFRNRFDYNRPEIQDLFKAKDGETATNFCKEIADRKIYKTELTGEKPYQYNGMSCDLKEFFSVCQEITKSALDKEEKRLANFKKEEKEVV